MKFLCRNCKAKYQIADEKVAGRTLRMTCQQCGEAIAVRGPGRAAAQQSRPISQPLQPVALGAQAVPSALGADFQRQINQPSSQRPAAPGGDEWHVAINDVPVGPMRRDEVARKIAMGSIDRDALAWREGMDDWMPAKHIPELSVLFPALPGLPAPPPAAARGMQPTAPLQPAARVEMAPMGGRQMLSLDDYAPPMPMPMATPAVTIQSMPSEVPPAAAKPLGWAQMFALVSGGALIMMLGAVLGVRVLAPPPAQQPAQSTNAGAGAQETARAAKPAEQEDTGESNTIELDLQDINGSSGSGKARTTGSSATTTDKTKPGGKQLTDEQKAMLERMGGGGTVPNLRAPTEQQSPSSGGGGSGQLTAEQLSKVVLGGRKNLQRCYETALRGSNSDETVRLDVEIEVSPNGNVTKVHAGGKGLPGMDECITRTVRMWRFPKSGETTQTRFPVVFQPGG